MGRILNMEEADDGWICIKMIEEAGQVRRVCRNLCKTNEEMMAWVEKNK